MFQSLFRLFSKRKEIIENKTEKLIASSNYISRDLSWLRFNYRVLDQTKVESRTIFEKLKFAAICVSNLEEFFMIRVGSLYNYLDYKKKRIDYSGLTERPFKRKLFKEINQFQKDLYQTFHSELEPQFKKYNFNIVTINELTAQEKEEIGEYFDKTVYPMLTPMMIDTYHVFPVLLNKALYFGVVTINRDGDEKEKRISFLQIPSNLPRLYEFERGDQTIFIPLEEIIRDRIKQLYRNIDIESATLFRIIRNGDFSLEDSDDSDINLIEELKQNLKKRKTGRIVAVEMENNKAKFLINDLKKRAQLEDLNFFFNGKIIDLKCMWQIVNHNKFKSLQPSTPRPIKPQGVSNPPSKENLFETLKDRDIILHHPYHSMEYMVRMLESAATDPQVLSIKITIYRLAKKSRIAAALLKAAENGKHVSVLFEVKARFDEENNIVNAQKLQKAGCFVIYGLGNIKTHCKLLLIVRKEANNNIVRYVHMASGNYNEDTAKLYTDTGVLSSNEEYASDVSELFNVITGHSHPQHYNTLITAPNSTRDELVHLVHNEIENVKKGKSGKIIIKVNSLQDKEFIDELYIASQEGVKVKLIVRGICCCRPGRKGLSENIEVKSIVGDFLEHSRIYYFENAGDPIIFGGSADIMVRSFERRIECLFEVIDQDVKNHMMHIIDANLQDNVNSYFMDENGNFEKHQPHEDEKLYNIHKELFKEKINNISPSDL